MTKDAVSIKEPIATRVFDLGDTEKVTVVIGAPFVVDEVNEDFCCPYQITGIGSEKIRRSIGVDPVQALFLALIRISSELYLSDEYEKGELNWMGDADLGLPVAESVEEDVALLRSRFEENKNRNYD